MIIIGVIILFVLSFLLAVKALKKELEVPLEIKNIKISKDKRKFGVIIFFQKTIKHYSNLK